MKANILILLLPLSASVLTNSQAQPGTKLKFFSVNSVGVCMGFSGNAFQLQTINGLRCKYFTAGMGVGLDHYFLHSIPAFADLRAGFFQKEQTPFLYMDLGWNLPGKIKKENLFYDPWTHTSYKKASYCDMGIGYSARLKKNLCLVVGFGYSVKNLSKFTTWEGANGSHYYEQYDYSLRRFSVKTGFSF